MVGIELNYCLLGTAIVLFHIGMLGLVLNRGNILKTIMSLELLLLSINLNFITFSLYLDDIVGYIFVFFILVLSATESSVGLAILSEIWLLCALRAGATPPGAGTGKIMKTCCDKFLQSNKAITDIFRGLLLCVQN